ncbi:helix-turn-helix domain-containing protein [Desulforamulus reducens]|uniref:helix-turn-helix domain-containing protein n=1 Tax=Desulforamulus reducens TaxID=59610 RepID=UPI0002D645D9|nr:helix-turn-helix domain-containing protein [Desulforamulus reducens]
MQKTDLKEFNKIDFITPTEVSRLLGVSRPTIYNWMKAGILKHYRIGGLYKIKKEDFNNFLNQANL